MTATTEPTGGSDARTAILTRIRAALGRGALSAEAAAACQARLDAPVRGPIPARGQGSPADLRSRFIAMAQAAAASVAECRTEAEVPTEIARFLAAHNLPARLRRAPDARLAALPWSAVPALEVSSGAGQPDDTSTVTGCIAGVAETGTLLVASGPSHPTTLEFLPETHIVLIRESDLVGSYEDAWDRLRAHVRAGDAPFPRAAVFITGPSRTGDIEQIIQMGAHGPRRLHIILIDG